MREDLIDRLLQRDTAQAPLRPWFSRKGRWTLPVLAASRCPWRARQARSLLLLIAASAVLCYGSLALGWRFATERHEAVADNAEAMAAGPRDRGVAGVAPPGRVGADMT